MGDLFTSLASQRSAITTLFTLVLFCALLLITWPASRYPYKIERGSRIHAYWLILLYFVFAMNDGDWFHLYNTFHDSAFRMRDVSEVTSQSAGLERVYLYIAKIVNYNYILFRFIVWGSAAFFSYLIGKRLKLNENLYLFFFIIISLDIFSFQRACLAMALGFLGYTYIIKPIDRHKAVSFILGLSLIYFSTFFHKSALFLIPVFFLSLLRINKRGIIILVLAIPVLLYITNRYMGDFLLNLTSDGSSMMNTNIMQSYLTRESRQMGIGSTIRNLLLPLMFVFLLVYSVKQVIIKKILLPKYILNMFNCALIVTVVSFLIATLSSVNITIIYLRLLYFSVLPFSVVFSCLYTSTKRNGSSVPGYMLVCIICSIYKIVLNLLGTIFL